MKSWPVPRPSGLRATRASVRPLELRLSSSGAVLGVPYSTVRTSDRAAAVFGAVFDGLPREELWVMLVGHDLSVRGLSMVARGSADAVAVAPVDVLRPVVVSGAPAFLLAHNHPSGDSEPSDDDFDSTNAVARASVLFGLDFLDHLVFGGDRYSSVREIDARLFRGSGLP